MELWLSKLDEIIKKSEVDFTKVDYKNIVYIFYEHLSNRNLAHLIFYLYQIDELDTYFEIDKIISKNLYNEQEVKIILDKLKDSGLEYWIESDDF